MADTIAAFVAVGSAPAERVVGRVLNAGTGVETSIADVVKMVGEILGVEPEVAPEAERMRPDASEVMRLVADATALRDATGWAPSVTLREGLARHGRLVLGSAEPRPLPHRPLRPVTHAVLLAGGKGTRLRPYTTSLPKPLVPLGEQSIIEIVLRQLASRGFGRATLAIGHLGHLIQAVVGDGSQWGIAVDYVTEDEPLGTMGPVVANRDRLPEHFLVLNGDVLTDLDYAAVLERHMERAPALTIATYRRQVPIDFGVLETDDDRVVAFREKPTLDYTVSMGVYGVARSTLDDFIAGEPLGFDELVLHLLERGARIDAYPFDGYWLDIGRPEDYDQANADYPRLRHVLLGS